MKWQNEFETFVEKVKATYEAQGIGIIGFDTDKRLYHYETGYRDVEAKLPITEDTVFGIASITKSFTVLGILKLVEAGKIRLDDPITQYIEELKLPKAQIPSIRQLMGHCGGFYPQERFLMKDVAKVMGISEGTELSERSDLAKRGIQMIVERLNQAKIFTGKPGEHHSYSNFSYGLLTALIDLNSGGKGYTAYMSEQVLKPLGLEQSFFEFTKTKSCENITKLYEKVVDHMNCLDDYEDNGFVLLGGGALKSSLNDLMHYTQMYLKSGDTARGRFLSEALMREMATAQVAYKPFEGYGLGLVTGTFDGIDYAGHSGGLTGVSSFFGFTKATGKGVVVLCNTSDVPATAMGIAALKMMNGIEPDWHLASFEETTWSDETITNTVGLYQSEEGAKIEIQAKPDGIAWMQGGERMPVTLVSDDAVLVHHKMLWSYAPIIRDEHGKARAIYSGSRMVPRK